MKAMIFAAGLGTRLKPLTDTRPKALVTVGGRTLLDITIERLITAGATNIVVNTHHFGEMIAAYLRNRDYEADISISDESRELLNTGGGLKHALPLFPPTQDSILIHNVDILHNADLKTFYTKAGNNDVTLLVSQRETSRYLLFDEESNLVGWTNIRTGEVRSPYPKLDLNAVHKFAFSGIHCVNPRIGRRMNLWPEKFAIMDFYLQECRNLKIKAYPVKGLRLLDVGKTDSLHAAETFLKQLRVAQTAEASSLA